jgi:H/ACA ribonucleoprotein complex subunit 4
MEKGKIDFGFINIDKSCGPTSFTVSSYVRNKLKLNKTSHMGTLDPKVTGVLPIALGRACRLAGYLIGNTKEYVGILSCHKEQEIKKLQEIINKNFVGKIKQTPPHKSAVKRAEREREVYFWNLIESSENKKDFLFIAEVEGGTYIRKLCSDLGEIIGGAHMAELRRTKAGIFDEEKMYTLNEFDNANDSEINKMIIPAEEIIKKKFKVINVDKKVIKQLLTGRPIFISDIENKSDFQELKINEFFSVFCNDEFIEIAKKIANENLVAKCEFVYN